jgi:hypothetical protein
MNKEIYQLYRSIEQSNDSIRQIQDKCPHTKIFESIEPIGKRCDACNKYLGEYRTFDVWMNRVWDVRFYNMIMANTEIIKRIKNLPNYPLMSCSEFDNIIEFNTILKDFGGELLTFIEG